MVESAFDAVRNEQAIFVDASLHLNPDQERYPKSIPLNKSNLNDFVQNTSKDTVIVLYGNNTKNATHFHNTLEDKGFSKVFYVGTLQELKEMKNT